MHSTDNGSESSAGESGPTSARPAAAAPTSNVVLGISNAAAASTVASAAIGTLITSPNQHQHHHNNNNSILQNNNHLHNSHNQHRNSSQLHHAMLGGATATQAPQHGGLTNGTTGAIGGGGRASPGLNGGAPVGSTTIGTTTTAATGPKECAGCRKLITERFLLRALDLYWHEDCLKCGCCDCRLGEVGSTLYTKTNLILCKRDYLRLFGTTGYCAACNKVIPAFEMVMRAKNNVYHLECFACQQCNHRFCVGDRFYLCDNKILCEYDYEERLVFANMAYNPSSLAHIRRQVNNLQSASAAAAADALRSPPQMAPPLPPAWQPQTILMMSPQPPQQPPTSPPLPPTSSSSHTSLCSRYSAKTQMATQMLHTMHSPTPLLPPPLQHQGAPQPPLGQTHPQPHQHHHLPLPSFMCSSTGLTTLTTTTVAPSGSCQRGDDGSSGYGSPDSETFETLQPPSSTQ